MLVNWLWPWSICQCNFSALLIEMYSNVIKVIKDASQRLKHSFWSKHLVLSSTFMNGWRTLPNGEFHLFNQASLLQQTLTAAELFTWGQYSLKDRWKSFIHSYLAVLQKSEHWGKSQCKVILQRGKMTYQEHFWPIW